MSVDHVVGAVSSALVFLGTVIVGRLQERSAGRENRTADWSAFTERMETWTEKQLADERSRRVEVSAELDDMVADRNAWKRRYWIAVRHVRVLRAAFPAGSRSLPAVPGEIEGDV